jgi:hypothetical protein
VTNPPEANDQIASVAENEAPDFEALAPYKGSQRTKHGYSMLRLNLLSWIDMSAPKSETTGWAGFVILSEDVLPDLGCISTTCLVLNEAAAAPVRARAECSLLIALCQLNPVPSHASATN